LRRIPKLETTVTDDRQTVSISHALHYVTYSRRRRRMMRKTRAVMPTTSSRNTTTPTQLPMMIGTATHANTPVTSCQGLTPRGQGLVSWSSRILEVEDFPQGQQHCVSPLNTCSIQCESKKSPLRFSDIFPNGWEFSVQILYAYYKFLSIRSTTNILIQLTATLTKLCHIKRDHPVHTACAKCPPSAETHAGIS